MLKILLFPFAPEIDDPTDGVSPNMGLLGTQANTLFDIILAIAWGIGIAVVVVYFIMGWVALARARGDGQSTDAASAMRRLKFTFAAGLGLTFLGLPFDVFNTIGNMV